MEKMPDSPKRSTARKITVVPEAETDTKEPEKVTFKAFFDRQVCLGLYQPYQEKEFKAFCQDHKLKPQETPDTFQQLLAKY